MKKQEYTFQDEKEVYDFINNIIIIINFVTLN